ncbi:MAG: type II toxin-antitoxin system CcdA family antitoxin [Thermoanaerobaculia bacterium]|nr:type II toxin-antitoxin system CcdA family antitoxin [Thermoanaerobaculia bacterium]
MTETPLFDRSAKKRPTNLSINSDLLDKVRALGINLSRTLEGTLEEILAQRRRQEWIEENREAVDVYNRRVSAEGVFSDPVRRF